MTRSNKDKTPDPIIDEVLSEDPPSTTPKTEPIKLSDVLAKDPNDISAEEMDLISQNKEELTEDQQRAFGLIEEETKEEDKEEIETPEPTKPVKQPVQTEETEEQKEKRYRAQQSEAQILLARNKDITAKVEEATNLPEPTTKELKEFVSNEGADWDELTPFEKSMAKKSYLNERRLGLITDAVQSAQKIDAWAKGVDEFIDATDGKPQYSKLSSHETEFRKFAMQENHRGVDLELLMSSFLYNLPPSPPKRGSLFERGGGGDKTEKKEGITEAELVTNLRVSDPREYRRQVKAGKIKIEV